MGIHASEGGEDDEKLNAVLKHSTPSNKMEETEIWRLGDVDYAASLRNKHMLKRRES